MSNPRPIILLTRARAQSERLAQELRSLEPHLHVVISPVSEIEFQDIDVSLPKDYVFVATSENGITAATTLGIDLCGKVIWCVGPQTAQAAKELGAIALVGPGGALGLAQAIVQSNPKATVIYLRGAQISFDLEKALILAGIETVSFKVYAQKARDLNDVGRAILAGARPVILPIYSQMSAHRLAEQIDEATAPLRVVSISPAVAKCWEGPELQRHLIADSPTNDAMLRAIRSQVE